MLEQKRISVIGGGQMCEAIFSGAVASGVVRPEMASQHSPTTRRMRGQRRRHGRGTFWYSRSSRSLHAQCLRRCGMSFVLTS